MRDWREEQDWQSGTGRRGGTAVRLHRLQLHRLHLQQRVADGPGRPPEDIRHSKLGGGEAGAAGGGGARMEEGRTAY